MVLPLCQEIINNGRRVPQDFEGKQVGLGTSWWGEGRKIFKDVLLVVIVDLRKPWF